MTKWQPIETAPKDGTEILGIYAYRNSSPDYALICWNGKSWVGMCDGYRCIESQGDTWTDYNEPFCTHWMPLPEPPKEEE